MAYQIVNSRGDIIAVIPSGTVNNDATSLTLFGANYPQYGLGQNENFVFLTENFANSTAPDNAIIGQLWFNTALNRLYVYDTNGDWIVLADEEYVQAQKISPVFTGTPQAPTVANASSSSTVLATTAFVQNAINVRGLAPIANPSFTGIPQAPTAANGTSTTQIATTAFVDNLYFNTDLSPYATKASPTFTGVPVAPTAPANTSTGQLATTAFVTSAVSALDLSSLAPKASPALTGVPTTPTAANTTANTQIASTAFVVNRLNDLDLTIYATKLSPTLSGIPTAPTASAATNTQQLATTAFVQAQKDSPAFIGVPTAPTAPTSTSNTQIATTAYVSARIANLDIIGAQELAGSIKLWISATPPGNWALCNGQAVSRSQYATLFSRIGTTYGAGDGSTTFNLPNLQARFPIGVGVGFPPGATGGFADAAVVSHTHGATVGINDPGHIHQNPDYSGILGYSGTAPWITQALPGVDGNIDGSYQKNNQDRTSFNATVKPATTGISASVAISAPANATDGAGRNLPPYQSFYYIIKMSDDGAGGGTLQAGAGIDITSGGGFSTITNVGVTRLIAGAGITLSSETGNITITSSGGGGGTADIAGSIKIWGGDTEPTDWMFCDGRAISRTGYPSLFARIGTAFGSGDGSSTFNIPDFRGRTAVGTNSNFPRGSTGDLEQTPLGSVIAWTANGAIPNGWLLCNGASLARTGTYADLFAAIGTTYGGSGSNFNLPDYRAMFLRGLDEGRGIDPLRALNGPTPFQKGTAMWNDCGNSPGTAPGDLGVYALTSGLATPLEGGIGSTGKNIGKDSFGAVQNLYQPSYVVNEFAYASQDFVSKNAPSLQAGYNAATQNETARINATTNPWNQPLADGYYGKDVWWGITRPHNMAVRYIIKATRSTAAGQVGYQSAPYIIKVNDNGTQRSGSGGGDTSRAGDVKWVAYALANFPPGWRLADGSAVNRNEFPALFARIGTTYGAGNGTTTFNIPDLRGRFVISETAGATGANRANVTRGGVGGSADAVVVSHTHTVNDPGHGHILSTITRDQFDSTGGPFGYGQDTSTGVGQNVAINNNVTGISINAAGESGTGKNLPPYLTMVAIIKMDDDSVNTGGILQAGTGISITTSGIYTTISATGTGGGGTPVVAGPGITVQGATGGSIVSANVRNIVSAAGSSITVTNNNGVFEIGGGGGSGTGGRIAAFGSLTSVTGRSIERGDALVPGSGFNIATATYNGLFNFVVTFATPMPDNNYKLIYSVKNQQNVAAAYYFTVSTSRTGFNMFYNTGISRTDTALPTVDFIVVSGTDGGGGGGGGAGVSAWGLIKRNGSVDFPQNGAFVNVPFQVYGKNIASAAFRGRTGGGFNPSITYEATYFFTSAFSNTNYAVVCEGNAANLGAIPATTIQKFTDRLIISFGVGSLDPDVNMGFMITFGESGATTNAGLGFNQTWQNVTASRVKNTNYTNATGSPIQVNVSFLVNRGYIGSLLVDNVVVGRVASGAFDAVIGGVVSAVVPPGSTYRASTDFGAVDYWAELR